MASGIQGGLAAATEDDVKIALDGVLSEDRPTAVFRDLLSVNAVAEPATVADTAITRWASPGFVDAVAGFSVMTHFDGFQKGVISLGDSVFFLSVIGFALFATDVVLRNYRAG